MYREGGVLLVTLSGRLRSGVAGSHVTLGHRPVRPVPEHSPGVAAHTRARGWRRSPTGGSAAVPRGPLQPWKDQLHPCGWMVAPAWGRGHSGAIRSETEADACFELFSSLLVPPNEMFKCLSLFRLGLRLSPASCWQPLEADQTPPTRCRHRPGAGPVAHDSSGACFT